MLILKSSSFSIIYLLLLNLFLCLNFSSFTFNYITLIIEILNKCNYNLNNEYNNIKDIAYQVVEEYGHINEVSETIARYFAYEAFECDLGIILLLCTVLVYRGMFTSLNHAVTL